MNDIAQFRLMKTVDIKHGAIINNFKYQRLPFVGYNIKLKHFIRIALMRVNHQVGTHLINGEYYFAYVQVRHSVFLKRHTHQVPYPFQVFNATADFILVLRSEEHTSELQSRE